MINIKPICSSGEVKSSPEILDENFHTQEEVKENKEFKELAPALEEVKENKEFLKNIKKEFTINDLNYYCIYYLKYKKDIESLPRDIQKNFLGLKYNLYYEINKINQIYNKIYNYIFENISGLEIIHINVKVNGEDIDPVIVKDSIYLTNASTIIVPENQVKGLLYLINNTELKKYKDYTIKVINTNRETYIYNINNHSKITECKECLFKHICNNFNKNYKESK